MIKHPVVRHILMTIAVVAVIAIGFIALGVLLFALFSPEVAAWIGLPLFVLGLGMVIYHSSRWSAYSAPIATEVRPIPWKNDAREELVTVVERANMRPAIAGGAGSIRIDVLRVSLYPKGSTKRLRRVLIGDDAVFLGLHGDRLWFFIESRFYARKNGLVGIDPRTLETTYHRPRKGEELVEKRKRQHPEIELETKAGRLAIDLREPPESS
ncbi:MAG: hypothetical protein AAF196_01045 [Planctomycetota bacterium]